MHKILEEYSDIAMDLVTYGIETRIAYDKDNQVYKVRCDVIDNNRVVSGIDFCHEDIHQILTFLKGVASLSGSEVSLATILKNAPKFE